MGNYYPMIPKARVMLGVTKIRPNMYIYKVNHAQGPQMPCVILEDEGDCGKYNRANRSMHNFTEYAAQFVFLAFCAGQVFPFPTFVVVCVAAFGRVLHMLTYSASGFGPHEPGYLLWAASTVILEMLTLIAGIQHMRLS